MKSKSNSTYTHTYCKCADISESSMWDAVFGRSELWHTFHVFLFTWLGHCGSRLYSVVEKTGLPTSQQSLEMQQVAWSASERALKHSFRQLKVIGYGADEPIIWQKGGPAWALSVSEDWGGNKAEGEQKVSTVFFLILFSMARGG